MAPRLLQESLSQYMEPSSQKQSSMEGLLDIFRKRRDKKARRRDREREIIEYSLDDIPQLAPQLVQEFTEAVGEDNIPRDFAKHLRNEKENQIFDIDIEEKGMDFETLVTYSLYVSKEWIIFELFLDTVENNITSKTKEGDAGDVLFESQHFLIKIDEIRSTKIEDLTTKFRIRVRGTDDRRRQEAVARLRSDFNDYINTLYEDVRAPSSPESITVDYDEVVDVLEPHDSIKRHPNFIFGVDDGAGNYTGLLKYDDHLISVDWDHETTAYTIN